MPDNGLSAFGLIGVETQTPAAKAAQEGPESFVVAPANIAWPGGSDFNQGPGMPDQLICSYRAGTKPRLRPFSSRKGFRTFRNTLKKFKEVSSAAVGASVAVFAACMVRECWQRRRAAPGIEVTHGCFYGLAGAMATLISTPAKRCPPLFLAKLSGNAWLTKCRYQSLTKMQVHR